MGIYLDIYLEVSPLSLKSGKCLKADIGHHAFDISSYAPDMAHKQLARCISHWDHSQDMKCEHDENFGYWEQPNSRSCEDNLKTPLWFAVTVAIGKIQLSVDLKNISDCSNRTVCMCAHMQVLQCVCVCVCKPNTMCALQFNMPVSPMVFLYSPFLLSLPLPWDHAPQFLRTHFKKCSE